MVNASLNWASIVGIILFMCGCIPLFLERSIKRPYDLLVTPVFWLCGGILFFQGWRLDPILQFGQFLLSSIVIFVAYQNIKLRQVINKLKKHLKDNFVVDENNSKKEKSKYSIYFEDLIDEFDDSKFQKDRTRKKVERNKFKNKQKQIFQDLDYISLLALEEDFDESELKRAYRREARKWHPDLNKNDKKAEAQFKLINEAYEFLNKQLERKQNENDFQQKKEERFSRGFGKYTKKDLELMTDDQVYELVKLQLLAISTGEYKAGTGEVEYLEYILDMLN